jgi:hypothetical protein
MQHLHFHTHTHTFNFLYYLNNSLFITATITAIIDLKVGSVFEDIPAAKAAIKAYLADAAKSWKTTYFDKSRFCIVCKQNNTCNF